MSDLSLIDAHVHADGLSDADIALLASFGVEQVLVCAHDGAIERLEPTVDGWVAQFERLLGHEAARFRRHGVRALFALGVHPAHAPVRGLERLLHLLPGYLSHPAVVAIGALGFKTGDARERWVLGRQLEMAETLRRPALVSAPPLDPDGGLRPLAALLHEHRLPASRILVERLTARHVLLLRELGFYMALEPSPGRLSMAEIESMVKRHGPERFVLSSHAGDGAANVLAVPQTAAALSHAGLSDAVVERLGRRNLLRFIGRDDAL